MIFGTAAEKCVFLFFFFSLRLISVIYREGLSCFAKRYSLLFLADQNYFSSLFLYSFPISLNLDKSLHE